MALVTSKEMLLKAMKEKYAVPAFNANSLEMIPALINAAQMEASPIIIQIGRKYLSFTAADEIGAFALYLAKKAEVPVCIHLDHGADIHMVKTCLDAGYTSVMYDGSSLTDEENIKNTKAAVEMAAKKNIPVEGEVGQVLLFEQVENASELDFLTDPDQARLFVLETGVSSVAVAVGNVHRMRAKRAKLDFERIKAIRSAVPEAVPLVIHGSSGISDDDIKEAIRCGISKVNVATEFSVIFTDKIRAYINENPAEFFPLEIFKPAMDEVTRTARDRIRVLGANGKC